MHSYKMLMTFINGIFQVLDALPPTPKIKSKPGHQPGADVQRHSEDNSFQMARAR